MTEARATVFQHCVASWRVALHALYNSGIRSDTAPSLPAPVRAAAAALACPSALPALAHVPRRRERRSSSSSPTTTPRRPSTASPTRAASPCTDYMEGERWTRLIEVRSALPSRDLELRLFVRVFRSPDAVSPSDLSLQPYKLRSLVGLLYDILLYVQLRTALIA